MTGVASLGMYDAPPLHAANDSFWAHIAEHLRAIGMDVPARLTRDRPLEAVWSDPDLLLAQACGYPLVTSLHRRVRVVCTPVYTAPGCDGPLHRAAVVVSVDNPALTMADLRGARCAVNDPQSNTGYNLLRRLIAEEAGGQAFLRAPPLVTGSHARSLAVVAEGRADFAAVDCVTLAHLRRDTPQALRGTRLLRWSPPTPGLPFITSLKTPANALPALRQALRRALSGLNDEVRKRLMIRSLTHLPPSRYQEVASVARQAIDLGYPDLL